jgi:transcriptional regulator with XRE-family HTH domain
LQENTRDLRKYNDKMMPATGEGLLLTPVDRHVARRIKGKRMALGLGASDLANALGVDASQIEAYERAHARVPPEHLERLSEFLGVPLGYFLPAAASQRVVSLNRA